MRLLYFSRDYTTHDHRFLAALSTTGHQVYFLRLEGSENILENRPLPSGIEAVEWAGGKAPARLRDGLRLRNDLKRVIHQVKPDLVHAGPVQRSAFLVAMAGFHPLVSMSWGYDLLHDASLNPAWRWATRYTLQHSDAFVGDCNTIRSLARTFGMPDERIVTFPWGIDLEHFNVRASTPSQVDTVEQVNASFLASTHDKTFEGWHARKHMPENVATVQRANVSTFNLLSTRSWEPIYGIDVIARAFSLAMRKRPELHLTLLGGGSQYAQIRQLLLVGGSFSRVDFPGQVSYSQLPGYYQQTDLYISASHSDGTSISLLEAFATGTPAIVPDIPGNREWVIPGENGWLFPDGDVEALASSIIYAVDRRHDLPGMGRRARLLAEQRADWRVNFSMLEKAYEIALS
jgi:glycosyltransferase involved in cell wall biosynthesis